MEFRKSVLETEVKGLQNKINDLESKISSTTVTMLLETLKNDLNSSKNKLEKLINELSELDPSNLLIESSKKTSDINSEDKNEYSIVKDFYIAGGSFNPEENILIFRKLKIYEKINNLNMVTDELPHSILIKNKKSQDEIEYLFKDIKTIKILDEKSSKSFLGTTLKGVGGALLFGFVGMAAGVLTKKSKTQVFLGFEFNDGNKIIIISNKDSKGYKQWEGHLMSKFEF